MYDQEEKVTYLLVCLECNKDIEDPERVQIVPFESAKDRGQWASAHTKGTGHDRWWVKDQRK